MTIMRFISTFILLHLYFAAFTQKSEAFFSCSCPTPASFYGGDDSLNRFIAKRFTLPDYMPDTSITKKGKVKFTVLKNGTVGNFKIIEKAGCECDEEIIRILKLTKWKSALYNGKFIEDSRILPYTIIVEQGENKNNLIQKKIDIINKTLNCDNDELIVY